MYRELQVSAVTRPSSMKKNWSNSKNSNICGQLSAILNALIQSDWSNKFGGFKLWKQTGKREREQTMIGSYSSNKSPATVRKTPERKLKVAIEGNIASGKSTLLKKLSQLQHVEVLIEPVDQWRDIGGGNLIGRMYQDPKRWSYLFQSYVLLTMMELHHKKTTNPVCMLERSVFSARYCFVENLHKGGILDDVEYTCYCRWFEHIISTSPPNLDLIVYLRTSPDICYKRLQERGRQEEQPVQLSYLKSLHECYERWLGNNEHHSWHGNTPVLVINGDDDHTEDNMVHTRHSSTIISTLGLQIAAADR